MQGEKSRSVSNPPLGNNVCLDNVCILGDVYQQRPSYSSINMCIAIDYLRTHLQTFQTLPPQVSNDDSRLIADKALLEKLIHTLSLWCVPPSSNDLIGDDPVAWRPGSISELVDRLYKGDAVPNDVRV
jgi:hypothetical protein